METLSVVPPGCLLTPGLGVCVHMFVCVCVWVFVHQGQVHDYVPPLHPRSLQ